MKHQWNIDAIVDGCKKADRRAQEQLFRQYYGKLMGVCLRYIHDQDSAQEVVQEAFIKIFERIDGYDSTGSFEGWMKRIVANAAIDSYRKHKKDAILSDNDNDFKVQPDEQEDEWDFVELKAQYALEAINQLSPAYKNVFNLYVFEEYTHKEIAELLGISEGTSKSNLAKARMNLQHYLKEKLIHVES